MDVNLDEMKEEINERIAKLESKKIRIRERLKAIETKSDTRRRGAIVRNIWIWRTG